MDTRKDENELHLLGGSTVYKQDYAPEVLEDEMDLPAISDESDLDLLEGDIVRNIQVNIRMYDGWDE